MNNFHIFYSNKKFLPTQIFLINEKLKTLLLLDQFLDYINLYDIYGTK